MSRRGRKLSEEERRLWDAVRRSAKALREAAPVPEAAAEAAEPEKPKPEKPKPEKPAPAPPQRPKPPAPPPVAPAAIDRRTRARLSRGILDVDRRLDLHGLTQNRAHQRLRRFLEEAQADGSRLVLVITGKGGIADQAEPGMPERGVLRRVVPGWLGSAEFRHLVAGFDEAGRRHGGGGALYVRIRRRRGGDPA